jgi:hypothetical protein
MWVSLSFNYSTIANNTAPSGGGGGISFSGANATLSLLNTTVAYNNASIGGGVAAGSGDLSFINSIIANNTAAMDNDVCGTISVSNYTLYSSNVTITSNTGSIVSLNPGLGTLSNNNGPTQTIPLLAGSPAINGGFNVIGNADQRGVVYTANDIGSYAYNINEAASNQVTTTLDLVDPTDNLTSLREAITYAGTLGGANQTITFASNLTSAGNATITLSNATGYGPLFVNLTSTNLTIQGPTSGNSITVSGGNVTGIFHIKTPTTINNLSIIYGNGANLPEGGAIYKIMPRT